MLMCSPGNFQDLREHKAAKSFNEQYTSIFEKIPVSDQGRAMRGLDDWGFHRNAKASLEEDPQRTSQPH